MMTLALLNIYGEKESSQVVSSFVKVKLHLCLVKEKKIKNMNFSYAKYKLWGLTAMSFGPPFVLYLGL